MGEGWEGVSLSLNRTLFFCSGFRVGPPPSTTEISGMGVGVGLL